MLNLLIRRLNINTLIIVNFNFFARRFLFVISLNIAILFIIHVVSFIIK